MATPQPDYDKIRRNLARVSDGIAAGKITKEQGDQVVADYLKEQGVTLDEVRGVGSGKEIAQAAFSDPEFQAEMERNFPVLSGYGGPASADNALENVPMASRMAGGLFGAEAGSRFGPSGAFFGGILGAEFAGQLADLGVEGIRGKPSLSDLVTGDADRRPPSAWDRMIEASTNMAVDALMTGVGASVPYAKRRASATLRNMLRNNRAVQIGRDLVEAGMGVSKRGAALLMGSRTTQGFIELQRGLPVTSDIWQRAIDDTMEGISRYADDVSRMGGGSGQVPHRAGKIVQQGAETFAENIDNTARLRYGRIRAGGKSGSLDDLTVSFEKPYEAAVKVRDDIVAAGGEPPKWLNKMIDEIPAGITFREARLRLSRLARIGRNLTEEAAGESQSAAKRISPALWDAMEEAGKKLDPAEFKRFRATNAWYKDSIKRVRELSDIINGEDGIKAWRAATQGTTRDPAPLRRLKAALKPQEWNEYVSARIVDMGLETKGQGAELSQQFSPERFLSAYREMETYAPESLDLMFGRNTPIRDGVDRLARFGQAFREARAVANPSGTGSRVGTYLTLASGARALTAAAGMGSAYAAGTGTLWPMVGFLGIYGSSIGTSKLMTTPGFVNWMADGALISPRNFKGVAAHLGRLLAITKGQPSITPAVMEYLNNLSEHEARGALTSVLNGDAEGQTAADEAKKPVSQRFSEAAGAYTEQRTALAKLPEKDQKAWRHSMRNEASVMRFFQRAERDIGQINARLDELGKGRDQAYASRERGRLERERARIMNEALEFQFGVYGG